MVGALKKNIIMVVEAVFLSPLMDQPTGFGQMFVLIMFQQLFSSYRAIDEIDLKENYVKMMGPYNPAELLS